MPLDSVVLQAPGRTRLISGARGIPTGAEAVDGSAYDFRAPRPIGKAKLDTAFTDLERDHGGRARVRLPRYELGLRRWLDERYLYVILFTGDPLPDVNHRSLGIEPMTHAPNAFQSGDGLSLSTPASRSRPAGESTLVTSRGAVSRELDGKVSLVTGAG